MPFGTGCLLLILTGSISRLDTSEPRTLLTRLLSSYNATVSCVRDRYKGGEGPEGVVILLCSDAELAF